MENYLLQNCDFLFKFILIGDLDSGKSSILKRFAHDCFSDSVSSSDGIDFIFKNVRIDGSVAKLQIWDTAGQERFQTITSAYYKGTRGILVVFDKNNRQTFDNLDRWIGELKQHAPENVIFIILGNKSDLEPVISSEEAQEKASINQVSYIDVSAKTGDQVNFAFELITRQIIEQEKKSRIDI